MYVDEDRETAVKLLSTVELSLTELRQLDWYWRLLGTDERARQMQDVVRYRKLRLELK